MLALAVVDDGREQHKARAFVHREYLVDHLTDGLRFERNVVIRALRNARACEQQAQVIVDFGDCTYGRTRVV